MLASFSVIVAMFALLWDIGILQYLFERPALYFILKDSFAKNWLLCGNFENM